MRSIVREVALSGIIVTVLALPALPFIIVGTLAAALVGLVRTSIGQGIGWLVWVSSSYLIGVENIYGADRHGNVEFFTNGRDLWVNTDR